MTTTGFEKHDHDHCITTALQVAEKACFEKSVQFTPARRRAFEILLQEHRAMGAYEVLDQLRASGHGSQPPVAYRALDFLVKHGFVHRIERLNAFIACAHPGEHHAPCFLICTNCDAVAETPARPATEGLKASAAEMGFQVQKISVEAEGLCPSCVENAA